MNVVLKLIYYIIDNRIRQPGGLPWMVIGEMCIAD